jgi:hypothetical protein
MHLCYLDESGTPDIPGNTSHYILVGLSVPVWHWKTCDREIGDIRRKYGLEENEIHTAWIARSYLEQARIANFEQLNRSGRQQHVERFRRAELLRLQRAGNPPAYKQAKKNYAHTAAYVHLTFAERTSLLRELAECISNWGFARLFAACIDKVNFSTNSRAMSVDEKALEEIVSRFERYLKAISGSDQDRTRGLLIHDNNETVARKHTQLMNRFHRSGTFWTEIKHIIETPLFVNSQLTNMVQIADLCGYAIRRYLENKEEGLFKLVFERADRRDARVVGIRHFTVSSCGCEICSSRIRS